MSHYESLSWKASLPLDLVIRGYAELQKRLFSVPMRDDIEYFKVDEGVDKLKLLFATESFYNNWKFSYHAYGEILNMAMSVYTPDEYIEWHQYHIRTWDVDGYNLIDCHYEAHALEYWREHTKRMDFDREKGQSRLKYILNKYDVDYEVVTVEEKNEY